MQFYPQVFLVPLGIRINKNHSTYCVIIHYFPPKLQAVKNICSQTAIVLNSQKLYDYSFHLLPSRLPYCHSQGTALKRILFLQLAAGGGSSSRLSVKQESMNVESVARDILWSNAYTLGHAFCDICYDRPEPVCPH